MSHLPSIPRSIPLIAAIAAMIACVLAPQAPPAAARTAPGAPLVPFIVGGQEAPVSQFPWQVFVLLTEPTEGLEGACGGSILNATTILTAAHCVDHEHTTSPYPASDFEVVAGASNVASVVSHAGYPAGSEHAFVSSIRTHPYYVVTPTEIRDDVAVLTLKEPLTLSAPRNAQAIGLIASGATPAAGTAMSVSGYGRESGAAGAEPDYALHSATLTAVAGYSCGGPNSAVLVCAVNASSATCQGDSGGPLTVGSPAVQAGIVDFGPEGCPVGKPGGFSNLAAPEIRAFIEGSETPPLAARPSSPPVIRSVGAAPVDFGPLTCEPGGWSGSPSFTYTFQTIPIEAAAAQMLQSGPTDVYVPPIGLVGIPLVCIVQASNPGGVASYPSAPTPAIALDSSSPRASITSLKCHLRACTLSIAATDPNGVALGVEPWASYTVTANCSARKQKGRRPGKPRACHRTKTVRMAPRAVSPNAFRAAAAGLPYDEKVTFTALVSDAASLHPARPLVRSTTLRPPKRRATTRPGRSKRKRRSS